jgi:hypothetical protein
MNFDYVTMLGGIVILFGIVSLVRARKAVGWNRVRMILVGILVAVAGVGMIVPSFQNERQREVLNLQTGEIGKISIYSEGHRDEALAQINTQELLSEWVSILGTCEYHRLSHPLYQNIYIVEMEYQSSKLQYKLKIDSRDPNTVDLQPFEESTFFSTKIQFTHGEYRCKGLFDFLSKALQLTGK